MFTLQPSCNSGGSGEMQCLSLQSHFRTLQHREVLRYYGVEFRFLEPELRERC